MPAITAILVVLLEGAVADLPKEAQQLLPDEAAAPSQEEEQSVAAQANHSLQAADEEHDAVELDEDEEGPSLPKSAEAEVLASVATAAGSEEKAAEVKAPQRADGGREVRSGALRLLASIWSRLPAQAAGSQEVFPRFFSAVAPLTCRIATEVCTLLWTLLLMHLPYILTLVELHTFRTPCHE